MCDPAPRSRAISLAHGAAHAHDHEAWTRRQFLARLGLSAAGAALVGSVGASPVRALGQTSLLRAVAGLETDRVLVLVQLTGGNDGLNTVVPLRDDLYRAARPGLALGAADTFALDADTGLHAALGGLQPRWGEGHLAVVQAAGVPEPSLSHFRATDLWLTGGDGTHELGATGWAGRTLGLEVGDPEADPPAVPPALQIGTAAPLLFRGEAGGYGTALFDVDLFLQIAAGGDPYPTDGLPETPAGAELAFVRSAVNASFRYRDAIAAAATAGGDASVAYPQTRFAAELAAVAQMIKGRLGSRIYLVSLGSFDTHANQLGPHGALLGQLGGGLAAFFDDLGADADRVLAMTFSEFGRRVEQNGSQGTDHGTAAPLFLAGPGVAGGLFGEAPDLADLDDAGNLRHTTDFRRVYADVLRGWFGLDAAAARSVLGADYAPLGLVAGAAVAAGPAPDGALALEAVVPNPLRGVARVRYRLGAAGPARLTAFDALGRRVAVLADGAHRGGRHEAAFDAGALPAGVYVLRLETTVGVRTTRATVVR